MTTYILGYLVLGAIFALLTLRTRFAFRNSISDNIIQLLALVVWIAFWPIILIVATVVSVREIKKEMRKNKDEK